MRVVVDTNTIVSGSLWDGSPRRVLDAAHAGRIDLFTSKPLLEELEDVLGREKFVRRLMGIGLTPDDLVARYTAVAHVVEPVTLGPVILSDPDDDEVLACAIAAQAVRIVSGDSHLLDLKQYEGILILTAGELLAEIPD